MPRPATVASARENLADAKMVPVAAGAPQPAPPPGCRCAPQAHGSVPQHTGRNAAHLAAESSGPARGHIQTAHGTTNHQPNLMPRPETAPWLPRSGAASAGTIGSGPAAAGSPRGSTGESGSLGSLQPAAPKSERLSHSVGSAGGPQLAAQLAQFAAHAHAANGQPPPRRPSAGGSPQQGCGGTGLVPPPVPVSIAEHPAADVEQPNGTKEDDEAVRQQLLSLALRACRAGGTGVGEGVGMPVGLSELYKLGKAIGEGAFGFVRVAQQRLSRELIAVKTFEKVRLRDSSSRRRLENEIRVLQRIRHPNIVRLYEVFESPKRIHLCMEHVSHGTLHRHLTQHKRLPEVEVRRLVRQLVGALSYLHARSIAHRDIKLENVLLDEWCNVRLIDFGFAILSRGKLRVPCGSPAYTAPEILLAHEYDGQLADVWSLGVLIYVMLAGRFPFQGATRAELSRNVLRGSFASPSGISREPESLLRRVLVLDPHQRYTVDNVRTHPWMHRRASESEIVTEHTCSQKVDHFCREQMLRMGLPAESVDASLTSERHDHIFTTYQLLLRKKPRLEAIAQGHAHMGPPPPPEMQPRADAFGAVADAPAAERPNVDKPPPQPPPSNGGGANKGTAAIVPLI